LGKFDLITAFEVFEHVPDVLQLVSNLSALLAPDGLVLFSTMVSDGQLKRGERINWWYAAPRNGHISLFSKTSLILLGAKEGFNFASFAEGVHAYWRKEIPAWARHVIKTG
jgi:2-polyprenyl-3-methyl-5-hydroxy-6-metoxy-1,4-benzoquinol methylase